MSTTFGLGEGCHWFITISDEEVRWDSPIFENSFQVKVADIEKFSRRRSLKGGVLGHYVLETKNGTININKSVGLNMELFQKALVLVGVECVEV